MAAGVLGKGRKVGANFLSLASGAPPREGCNGFATQTKTRLGEGEPGDSWFEVGKVMRVDMKTKLIQRTTGQEPNGDRAFAAASCAAWNWAGDEMGQERN